MRKNDLFQLLLFVICTVAIISCQKDPSANGGNSGSINNTPSVKIMSFNIRTMSANDEHSWESRRDACCAMINYHRPVMMGTQEAKKQQREDILSRCRGYAAVAKNQDNTNDGQSTAIFYLRDSITVLDWGVFWHTDTPDKLSKLEECDHYRSATWIKAQHKTTSKIFYHINTHLDLCDVRNREKGMSVILDFISKNCEDYPVVMTADWNDTEDDPIFNEMYKTFKNARYTAPITDKNQTFNDFGSFTENWRIDHIFYRGFASCRAFGVDRQTWAGQAYISDHYSVWTILHF